MNVYCAFLENTPKWLTVDISYRMNSDILATNLINPIKPAYNSAHATGYTSGGYLFFMKIYKEIHHVY